MSIARKMSRKLILNRTKISQFRNLSRPVIPPCSSEQPKYTGISYNEALDIRKDRITPSYVLYYKKPIMVTKGYKQWIWDEQGKRYLDMFGGIVTISVGHCHPKVTEAALNQLNNLWHTTNIYMHPTIHEYAKKLTDKFPGNLKVCYFCNSGSEANDLAMFLARVHTGAFDIISLRNAYHGASPYTNGLCGIGTWKHNVANGFGIHHVMNPDPYRGIWGGSHCRNSIAQTDRQCDCNGDQCKATDNYINQLEETIKSSMPNKIAGFIAEYIQGVGGTVQLSKGYLKKAYEIIRNHGGLCIADEVQTGFGRTGNFWGFQDNDIVPDIVTLGKGIGNGFPLAAVITTSEIMQSLKKALHFNTYGGNPVACAVGSAVLDVIEEEHLSQNAVIVGSYLLRALIDLKKTHNVIGDVRGKGLMIGVDLVKSKETKEPLPKADMDTIFEDTKNMGLLLGRGGAVGNVFRIKPPMCVTQADADFCLAVFDEALSNFEKGKH